MNRIIQIAMFISVFFVIFLILNSFIFYTVGNLINLSSNSIYFLIFLFSISYPAASILERTVSHILTRAFYTFSSAWMGITIYFVLIIIIYKIFSLIFYIPPFTAGIVIIALTVVISAYAILNSIPVEIKKIEINIPTLKKNVDIVQLSDMHIGSVRNSGFMSKIVKKTNDLKPDIVLVTGDTVDGSAKIHPGMFNAIEKIKAPVFLIMGNHEYYEGLENVLNVLNTLDITILRDEIVEIQDIQIIGVDYSYNKDHLKYTLSKLKIDKSKPSVLMYHVPNELEAANHAGIDLQISGHTHKGQLFPFNLFSRLVFPYFNGLYNYNNTTLYVSQGTGTWGPPMRLGSKNEITQIKLKNQ